MTITLPFTQINPRIALFGIDCHFTSEVLSGLVAGGADIAALVLPGPPRMTTPITVAASSTRIQLADAPRTSRSVVEIATGHAIRTFRVGDLRSNEAVDLVGSFGADRLVCACYPRLIPRRVTRQFANQALNVHPSLLPDKRGPDPLFWTFRAGDGQSGVTIHELASRFDAGDIVAQRRYTYPDGTSEAELETRLAAIAVELLLDSAEQSPAPRKQDDASATYAPFPTDTDYALDRSMPARAAYNFVRGVRERGVPITVEHEGTLQHVVDVVAYDAEQPLDAGDRAVLEFSDGFLIARLAPFRE